MAPRWQNDGLRQRGRTGCRGRAGWWLAGVAVAVVTASTLAPQVGAESLWAKAGQPTGVGRSLFADARARQVGDLLTLLIVERSEATSSASTQAQRKGETQVGAGEGLLAQVLPFLGGRATSDFNGAGRTLRSGVLRAQMTVKVTQVLPSGALAIEGRQAIQVNEEAQEIVVTGVVRPEDIGRDNTVLSTYVADAQISFQGEGALGGEQKPGLLTRLFGWIF